MVWFPLGDVRVRLVIHFRIITKSVEQRLIVMLLNIRTIGKLQRKAYIDQPARLPALLSVHLPAYSLARSSARPPACLYGFKLFPNQYSVPRINLSEVLRRKNEETEPVKG